VQEYEFKKIYATHGRKVYNFLLWLTHDKAAAEDVLQTVFVKVWQGTSIPENDAEAQRWLFTVARNASLDFFRKSARFSRFRTRFAQEHYDEEHDPDAPFTWRELDTLPEIDKSILYLHIKTGYTYKEIGDMLGITENLVRVKAFRALKKVREQLVKRMT
jgi:RNA polymerase sigma-70 factor (ECF subfamily)